MDEKQHIISIPEITRVEGHSAVVVNMSDGKIQSVKLDVFEGTRFFEKIVIGHKHYELPHITSRVCAICSTGHVLAAIRSIEGAMGFTESELLSAFRHLMHLGMIIESHATHLFALVLPDYLGCEDIVQFATQHAEEFDHWNQLRKLGSTIQTLVGGRPFHPVNVQVGGLSRYPTNDELLPLPKLLESAMPAALQLAEQLLFFNSPVRRETQPVFAALIPGETYGYFGTRIQTTDGQELDIQEYREYLGEVVVPHSHAKRSEFGGRSFMVGSIGRLQLFHQLLQPTALGMYRQSPLAAGDTDTIYNNFGQSVEIIDAIEQCIKLIHRIQELDRTNQELRPDIKALPKGGMTVGAVECPRGTLYHSYSFDEQGAVVAADMVTPSAQNTARIERDIYEVVESSSAVAEAELQQRLETLIRAYDPCNTCATHMVRIQHS